MLRSLISTPINAAVRSAINADSGRFRPTFRVRPNSIPAGGSFSRGTLATQVNADGSVGWAPHNLLTQSQFSSGIGAVWTQAGASAALSPSYAAAPDGTLTAARFTATTAGHGIRQYLSTAASGQVTGSLYVMSNTGSNQTVALRYFNNAGQVAQTFTATSTWQRISFSDLTSVAGSNFQFDVQGVGATDVLVWGVQLNLGPLQPYYPTTGTAFHGLRTADFSDDPLRRGIKIEPQATNLATNSATLQGGLWTTRAGTAVAAGAVGPDLLTACSNYSIGTSSDGYVYSTGFSVPTANTTYTLSVYAKGVGTIDLNAYSGAQAFQSAPIATTNEWKRYSFSFTATAVGSGGDFGVHVRFGSVALFGAQLETGPVATSYIPTAGAAVTRGADVWTYPVGAVTGWRGQQGTWLVKTAKAKYSDTATILQGAPKKWLFGTDRYSQFYPGANMPPTPIQDGAVRNDAVAFTSSSATLATNGVSSSPASADFTPTLSTLTIGSDSGVAHYLNGTIYALDYYPAALPAARLQALTAP